VVRGIEANVRARVTNPWDRVNSDVASVIEKQVLVDEVTVKKDNRSRI
jgi:hypothetical protein